MSPYGGGLLDIVTARIDRARVGSLVLWIGGAGD
jgi:hypothetical protein